ncbi:MAG TPA: hypothetical protein VGN64_15440, partial [Dyadobacter sp.]|nr:hypothetical protein [Dyadobacter sp.]
MAIDQPEQMPSTFPDIARIQPTQEFLNIILKNTHFNDDLLKDSAKTKLHISYYFPIPVAVIRFAEAFYDFILPLRLSAKDLSVSK